MAKSSQILAFKAGLALERVSHGVSQINERNLVIANAAEEQAQVVGEVDRNLINIQDLYMHAATGANQPACLVESFRDLLSSLTLRWAGS